MIQGILILAHKNTEQLMHLIGYFSTDCYVFIHIDCKSNFSKDHIKKLRAMPQVKGVYEKYAVHWAGFSILKCELFLLRKAMEFPEIGYFHLLSGQDYPIKPLDSFLSFFASSEKEYLYFAHIPDKNWEENTYRRYNSFFLFDYLGRTEKARKFVIKTIELQRKMHIRRKIPQQFEHLYGGSAWFSITRKGAETLTEYTRKHPSFYRRLRFTFCPEETYVSTVLVNLLTKKRICNNNYRYIRWTYENGSRPANLSEAHFHYLHESDAFFARKFEYPVSAHLIDTVDTYLLKDAPFEQMDTGGWKYNGLLRYGLNYELVQIIYTCHQLLSSHSLVDFGCGAGNYVAALRRLGIPAMGYDANPHTPELSKLLLTEGEPACETADLTEKLCIEEAIDTVLCIDVLQHIPRPLLDIAVKNLMAMTGKLLIIKGPDQVMKSPELTEWLAEGGLRQNMLMSRFAQRRIKDVYIFEKDNVETGICKGNILKYTV